MYRTAPPVADRVSREIPLRLTRAVHREFADGTCSTDDPELYRYYADLATLHGIDYRQDVLEAGAGNTFIALADAVLAGLVSDARPVDLAIIAHSLPDLDPRVSAGVSLTRKLPGEPLVFAISSKEAVAFTALRVAGDYARRHSYRRVLVIVLDQTRLPYQTTATLARDAAVALLLEDAPGNRIAVGHVAGVTPDDLPKAVAGLAGNRGKVVESQRPGATGIWAGFEQEQDGDTVLVDYQPARGDLRYCAIYEREGK